MSVNEFRLRLVANDNASREKGLMFADPLAEDEVALFVFPHSDRYAFWNRNVSFGLTLAFLDENGRVVDTKDLEAQSESMVSPDADARFVVELKKGTLEKLGAKKGDTFLYENGALKLSRHGENETYSPGNRIGAR